jgi:hypothetical protein
LPKLGNSVGGSIPSPPTTITTTRPRLAATPAQRAAAAHARALIDQATRLDPFARAIQRARRGEREVIRRAIMQPGHARRAAKIGRDR